MLDPGGNLRDLKAGGVERGYGRSGGDGGGEDAYTQARGGIGKQGLNDVGSIESLHVMERLDKTHVAKVCVCVCMYVCVCV